MHMQATGLEGKNCREEGRNRRWPADINTFDFSGLVDNGPAFQHPPFLPLGKLVEDQLQEEIRNQQQYCTDTMSKLEENLARHVCL